MTSSLCSFSTAVFLPITIARTHAHQIIFTRVPKNSHSYASLHGSLHLLQGNYFARMVFQPTVFSAFAQPSLCVVAKFMKIYRSERVETYDQFMGYLYASLKKITKILGEDLKPSYEDSIQVGKI